MPADEKDHENPPSVPPQSKPHRWVVPTSPTGQPVCDLCGYPMRELHCKLICDQCGYIRDCSDP